MRKLRLAWTDYGNIFFWTASLGLTILTTFYSVIPINTINVVQQTSFLGDSINFSMNGKILWLLISGLIVFIAYKILYRRRR